MGTPRGMALDDPSAHGLLPWEQPLDIMGRIGAMRA